MKTAATATRSNTRGDAALLDASAMRLLGRY